MARGCSTGPRLSGDFSPESRDRDLSSAGTNKRVDKLANDRVPTNQPIPGQEVERLRLANETLDADAWD